VTLAKRRQRILLLLAGIGFGLRLVLRLSRGEADFLQNGYTFNLSVAQSVLDGNGFCWMSGGSCAARMPVYPLLIGPFLWSGSTYPGLVVLEAAAGAAMVWVAWRLGVELFDARAGLLAAAMAALSPYALVHDTALQDTVIVNLLVGLGVALLLRARRTSSGALFFAGGVVVSLAVLTSARIAYVLPIAWIWTAVCCGDSWARRLQYAPLVGCPILVLVGGWMVRNSRLIGSPVLSTQAGTDLWAANNPWTFDHIPRESIDRSMADALSRLSPEQQAALDAARSNELASSRVFAEWAFDYMKTHRAETLAGNLRKMWVVVSAELSPARGRLTQAGYAVLYGTVHLLAIVALWRSRSDPARHSMIWAFLFAFSATTAIYWAHTSHKSVIDVFLFVYAAGALTQWTTRASHTTTTPIT